LITIIKTSIYSTLYGVHSLPPSKRKLQKVVFFMEAFGLGRHRGELCHSQMNLSLSSKDMLGSNDDNEWSADQSEVHKREVLNVVSPYRKSPVNL
jgi:hypothetical protein